MLQKIEMEALRAQSPTSGFQIETVPIPALGPNDVLIKVTAAGISPGVVKMTKFGRAYTPCTLGHEAAGTVAAVGDRVEDLALGSRIRLNPILSCRRCFHCTRGRENLCSEGAIMGFMKFGGHSELYDEYHDGTIAEYVRAPRSAIDRLPDNVSFEVGAKVHDIATALHTLKVAEIKPESTVVLMAATGTMGALTLAMAHFFPIRRIILVGRSRSRMEQVCKLTKIPTDMLVIADEGAPSKEAASTMPALAAQLSALAPEGIDIVIDYLPSGDILPQILPALRPGGTLVHMGGNAKPLLIPLVVIMNKAWKVTGSRANTREDVAKVLEWLEDGKLEADSLITHRFHFSETHKMLELLENRGEPVWLSVLNMDK